MLKLFNNIITLIKGQVLEHNLKPFINISLIWS